jgi:hypothetical protein
MAAATTSYSHSSIYATIAQHYEQEAPKWVELQKELIALSGRCQREDPSALIPAYYTMRKKVHAAQKFTTSCQSFLQRTEPVASRPAPPSTPEYTSPEYTSMGSGPRYWMGKTAYHLLAKIQPECSPFSTKLAEVQNATIHFLHQADQRIQERVTDEWNKAKAVLEILLKSRNYPLSSTVPVIGNVPFVGPVINATLRRINNQTLWPRWCAARIDYEQKNQQETRPLDVPFLQPLPQQEASDPPTSEEAIQQLSLVARKIQYLVSADIARLGRDID